jgi:hypothetical protein
MAGFRASRKHVFFPLPPRHGYAKREAMPPDTQDKFCQPIAINANDKRNARAKIKKDQF